MANYGPIWPIVVHCGPSTLSDFSNAIVRWRLESCFIIKRDEVVIHFVGVGVFVTRVEEDPPLSRLWFFEFSEARQCVV